MLKFDNPDLQDHGAKLLWDSQARGTGKHITVEEWGDVSISDAIAGTSRFANLARADAEGPDDHLQYLANEHENLGGILSWFRTQGVATVSDMLCYVRERKVPLNVLNVWVDEFFRNDTLPSNRLTQVIIDSYPEVGERMELYREQGNADTWESINNSLRNF